MVRKIVFSIVAITCSLAAASCGSSGGAGSGQTVIRLQAFGDPAEVDSYRELIAAFERENPDIHVQFIPVGKQKDHMAKLTTSFVGGDPPDLFLINFRRYGQFAEKGVLEPLGPRIFERGKIKQEDLYEQPVEAFTYKGTVTCVPQNASSLVVYYNRKLFQDAGVPFPRDGWLWKDFSEAALKLTKDVDGDGKTDVYGVGFEPYLIRIAPFVWQTGGDIVDDLHHPTTLTLDQRGAATALAFLKLLHTRYQAVPPQTEAMTEDADTRFARGGLGMLLQSRRYTATLRPIKDLDWDVGPLPMRQKNHTVLHADAYCMAKDSGAKDAAYRFVEFALSPAGAEILARSGRTVPAVKSIAESPVFLDPTQRPQSARVFLDSIPFMRRTPNTPEWNEVEARVDPLLEEWFYEPAAAGDPDAELPIGPILNAAVKDLFQGASP
jgi:multiple sugar transport system substrate-binding protein